MTQLKHEGFFIDHRRIKIAASPESIYQVFTKFGGRSGWLYGDWLWKLRGWLDHLIGGPGLRGQNAELKEGDAREYFRVESLKPNHEMRLRSELKAPGDGWMEWCVESKDSHNSILTQTAFFAPRGLPGFLYWYWMHPLHGLVLHGLIQAIADKARQE